MTTDDIPLPRVPPRPRVNHRRLALAALARATRPARHALRIRQWPLELRARLGRANDDELAALDRQRRAAADQRALQQRLNQLAAEYKRLIINALTRVGVSYSRIDDGKLRFSKVEFYKPAVVTLEAIYYQVNTSKLPYHVSIADLLDERVTMTLSAATKRVVSVHWNKDRPEDGCWIVVELRAGVRGIPRHVDYSEMLAAIRDDAPALVVPIGRGVAGAMKFDDIADMPHLLIGGATKQGKSVWMKQALMTILMRNTPRRVKLIMIDLKGGVELGQFKNVPHLLIPVIKENDRVVEALNHAAKEIKRRLAKFEERGVVDIKQWNRKGGYKLEYWIIVIDELASLMLDKEIKNDVDRLLGFLAAQGRAPGIHVIAATQRPEASVVTGLIKANFSARLAFSCADYASSKVILDTTDAAGIGPAGRMIYFTGKEKLELQGPLVTPDMVDDAVGSINAGQGAEALDRRRRHNFSPEDFFRHALKHYDGRFPLELIWEDLKTYGVTRDEVRAIGARYDGQEIEVDGITYKVMPPEVRGQRKTARQLLALSQDSGVETGTTDSETIAANSLSNFQAIDLAPQSSHGDNG